MTGLTDIILINPLEADGVIYEWYLKFCEFPTSSIELDG